MLFAAAVGATMVSCSDDDNLGEAPRLFRPIASSDASSNNLVVTWDKITGATSYTLDLYRVTGTDENGDDIKEKIQTVTTTADTYTFENLEWDEKYAVSIKATGETKESEYYDVDAVNINYPTKVSEVKTIDNAARISWKEGGDVIKMIVAIPAEGTDTVFKTVSTSEYEQGYADVNGLSTETSYTFKTYSDKENLSSATYAGRISGTTKASVNFDEKYGEGMWLDIRNYDEQEAKDTLKSSVFWEQVKDGMTIILRGEQEYKVNGDVKFDRSVTFITGQTLGGNAKFISSGGMGLASNVTIDKVKFEDIDIYSDKQPDDATLRANTDKGFGGRQVVNINGTKSTVNELIFNNCYIQGYRAVVRVQAAGEGFQNVTFKGCTINGIGDQGVITTNNKKADIQNVTFEDCTILNIVMLADFRASASAQTLNISNCTFCYAPIETTANANTPLLRLGSNAVTVNISGSLFGPSMASEGSGGSKIATYTAGTAGSILLNASATTPSVAGSYKTNFGYTQVGTNLTTYPIDGLTELSYDETKLWNEPSAGDFKIISTLPSTAGATKWIQ